MSYSWDISCSFVKWLWDISTVSIYFCLSHNCLALICTFNQSRVRVKGTGVKAKTSPETEPDFYSMPFIKADDSLTILNTNFEGNSATALFEDKIKLSNPALNKKKHAFKEKYCVDRNVFYSPVNKLTNGAPKTVTPVKGSNKELFSDPSSSFGLRSNTSGYIELSRHVSKRIDTCPPLLSSCSKDTNDLESSSRRESVFGKILSDSSLMALQSLHEPILSPSSSSFSLDEMSEQQGSLEINTDTIFSDQGFDGEWGLKEKFTPRHIYARLAALEIPVIHIPPASQNTARGLWYVLTFIKIIDKHFIKSTYKWRTRSIINDIANCVKS